MIDIGIIGAKGRMGRAIAQALEDHGEARLAGGADQGDDVEALARSCDVLIDFSSPAALSANLAAACSAGRPLVVGTTGLGAAEQQAIHAAAAQIAVLQAANMSLGVNLLAHFVS